jgi:hypothetical protein
MALTTYAELQSAIVTWALRTGDADFLARTVDCITLFEAKANRVLGAVETDAALVAVVDSRNVSISALSIVQPISVFLAESGSEDEVRLNPQSAGTMAYSDTSGTPTDFTISGENIVFNRPASQAFDVRLHYRQRFALSDIVTTNWLLENHPDVYLAGSMMWGAGYQEDWQNGALWKGILEEATPEIRGQIAQSKRGTLKVDPALMGWNRGGLSIASWTAG